MSAEIIIDDWGEDHLTEIRKQLLEDRLEDNRLNREDKLEENRLNRKLKAVFGGLFLFLTFLFTAVSYSIVVFDAKKNWGISEIAITALIIEIPIQFIGLLYIIARNLFPQGSDNDSID